MDSIGQSAGDDNFGLRTIAHSPKKACPGIFSK